MVWFWQRRKVYELREAYDLLYVFLIDGLRARASVTMIHGGYESAVGRMEYEFAFDEKTRVRVRRGSGSDPPGSALMMVEHEGWRGPSYVWQVVKDLQIKKRRVECGAWARLEERVTRESAPRGAS